MKLHFQEPQVVYSYGSAPRPTIDEVAQILEDKYAIMRRFLILHHSAVEGAIEDAMKRAISSLIAGRQIAPKPSQAALQKIEYEFRQMLLKYELDFRAAGVPTKASLLGYRHRMKMPYAKYVYKRGKRTEQRRPKRPSFWDSGAYATGMHVIAEKT